MNIIIERLDGTIYSFKDYNIDVIDFKVDSPSPRFNFEEIENRDGVIDVGTTYGERKLRGVFEFVAEDYQDFPLLRNKIFNILHSKETFYLIDDRELGKRWKVKANSFSPEQILAELGKFDVEFVSPSSFAESVGTTLDPLTFDAEMWQIGQGLESDDLVYVYETTSFSVFNAGDVTIDPRELPLKITFTGESANLSITNNTTGDVWTYTGSSVDGDNIVIDGVKSTKNGTSIFGDTNRQLLTLEPGWNNFTITGASGSFEITFDFRFYYL